MNKNELKQRLQKSVDFFISDISKIKTGRANPSLIENVKVNAYGSMMSLKELGSISSLDSQTLSVSPWDKSLISTIAKAIQDGELNLNPSQDSQSIIVPIPPLTQERRQELSKIVAAKSEESKQSIRSIRQEFMKIIDKDFTDKVIGEDEKFTLKEQVEYIIKEYTSKIDEASKNKTDDLMTV